MLYAALYILLSCPVDATPALGASQTLEALKAQAVRDPRAPRSEDAAGRAAGAFDGSLFHVKTLAPVEYVPATTRRLDTAAPSSGETARGATGRYYFERRSPVSGITIYTAKPDEGGERRGNGTRAGYGAWALGGGVVLAAAALAVGGPAGLVLGAFAVAALVGGAIFGRDR